MAKAKERKTLKSSKIVDMVVVLEDGRGSSILIDFRGIPIMTCGTMRECGLTSLMVCINVKPMI